MLLSGMGAEVIRIDRVGAGPVRPSDFPLLGRRNIAIDLKAPGATEAVLRLLETADGLIEGFRPGVMERLGLGPDVCHARNPRLVYGRITGWGQDGPLAHAAGHDLNYIALTGALWATGEADRAPTFCTNLLGDYGGGALPLALGMVAGLLQAVRNGTGDVVDAAICDGTNALMMHMQSRRAMGIWRDERAANHLDGGAPWYNVYECADGSWISIAPLEQKFWECLVEQLGYRPTDFGDRADRETWPATQAKLRDIFLSKPRSHWDALLEGTDACYAPVLSPAEARSHPHMAARQAFFDGDWDHPKPAPRFASQGGLDVPDVTDDDTVSVLIEAGFSEADLDGLRSSQAIRASVEEPAE